jgi:hypothetical protein
MKKFTTLLVAFALILGITSVNAQETVTYTDDFTNDLDFLTQEIPGTSIWEAYEYNAGTNQGQNCVLTGLRIADGALVFESENGGFDGGADDGVFLYRTVPDGADFDVKVKVVGGDFTSFTGRTLEFNSVGILVRPTEYAVLPDFLYAMMFEIFNIHHMLKSIDDAIQTEYFVGVSQMDQFASFNEYPWIRLTRVGNLFTTYTSADGESWTETNSVERADLEVEGIDLRVGLTHGNFIEVDDDNPDIVTIVPGVAQGIVDDFSLTHDKVATSVSDIQANSFDIWSEDRNIIIESASNKLIESSKLYSIDGRIISTLENMNDHRCQFTNIRNGLYIAIAEIGGEIQARKVVVR